MFYFASGSLLMTNIFLHAWISYLSIMIFCILFIARQQLPSFHTSCFISTFFAFSFISFSNWPPFTYREKRAFGHKHKKRNSLIFFIAHCAIFFFIFILYETTTTWVWGKSNTTNREQFPLCLLVDDGILRNLYEEN
jgi:hypothetical protein